MSENPPQRLLSLDAYRGFVMFLMAAEMLHLPEVAEHFSGSSVWQLIKHHTTHAAWTGCSLHDLIQPSFSFMVGVAVPFSLASRLAKGASLTSMWGHALCRALALVLLGVALRSLGDEQTQWTFEDTLSQIGLGYPFLFALGLASTRGRWVALAAIVFGYWAFFALWSGTGVGKQDWEHDFTGFAAHWNINANPAWAFDTWFLNLFSRARAFTGNEGGYSTLSFIPTLGTMLLGLIAGQWIKNGQQVVKKLAMAGLAGLAAGYVWHLSGLCPSVKKIWTPSWILFSGGWCMLFMCAFYFVLDVKGIRRWAYFFVVIGMNSIAMYVMTWTMEHFMGEVLSCHLGGAPFAILGEVFKPMLHGAAVLLVFWLILRWMHLRKIYLRL